MQRLIIVVLLMLLLSPIAEAHQAIDKELLKQIRNVPSQAVVGRDAQLRLGRRLFFRETFNGNGRTCGTCHPANNNFTIDPAFISRLPRRNPLFVAEFNPQLRGLENPALMRQFGLILENLDGFNNPGVMRGVPHVLALTGSRRPEVEFPLVEALGWSGDGSPGNGTLREFAIGAVVQHFPRTLQRRPGVDFRLPTEQELDALLAFQLSLGRGSEEVEIASLTFTDPIVSRGRDLFIEAPARDGSVRSCGGCHDDGDAVDEAGFNRNRDTGVNRSPQAPACRGDAPGDGGFGQVSLADILCNKLLFFRGDGTFNTPTLIEAADTPPFFHNNSASTIEEAVNFYTGDVFNNSAAGDGRAFVLSAADVNAIGAFLRSLNVLENIRQTQVLLAQVRSQPGRRGAILTQARAETNDAIEVLTGGQLFPGVVLLLRQSLQLQQGGDLEEAGALLQTARSLMLRSGG